MVTRGLPSVLVVEYVISCEWRSWSSEWRTLIGNMSLSFCTFCLLHDWSSWELYGQSLAHADWLQV
ncbi:hypothetical protein Hanom_Chr14g01266691 [Helianthus anomalus]